MALVAGYADRTAENTATTGTGALTLGGAIDNTYQAFQAAFFIGAFVYYTIYGPAGWEVGRGTLTATTTLTRDQVYASSNAGALVSLTASSVVFCTLTAKQIADMGLTLQFAAHNVLQ